jgi:hypothetical protein
MVHRMELLKKLASTSEFVLEKTMEQTTVDLLARVRVWQKEMVLATVLEKGLTILLERKLVLQTALPLAQKTLSQSEFVI